MSTQPTSYVPQYFKPEPRAYTLHNASPDSFDIRWGGLMFTVPGVNEVGPKPAVYDDGEPIPGTCVLVDASSYGPDGTVMRGNWRAEDAIRNVLGIDPETGHATGMAARHGISFLPPKPSKQLVVKIREDGEKRWYESQVEWAEHETAAYQVAIERAKDAGALPPTPGKDYRRAVTILERHHKRIDAMFGKAEEVGEKISHDDEIEMEVWLKAKAIQLAEKAATDMEVDKTKVAEEMLADPKIRRHLQKQWSIRKRGYTKESMQQEEKVVAQTINLPDLPPPEDEDPQED